MECFDCPKQEHAISGEVLKFQVRGKSQDGDRFVDCIRSMALIAWVRA